MKRDQVVLNNNIENIDCSSIRLEIVPRTSDVGEIYTLRVFGTNNTHPQWNTWVWERADKYLVGGAINDNPVWISVQTGGITHIQGGDDWVFRVKWVTPNCTHYSNDSGYERWNPQSKYYAKVNIVDTDLTGIGTLNISSVFNLGSGFNIDSTTDRITNVSGTIQYVQVTISLGARIDVSLLLSVYKNGVAIPNFKILHEISSVTTLSFTDIITMNNNDYLTFVYDADADNLYGNIIVETVDSYINIS